MGAASLTPPKLTQKGPTLEMAIKVEVFLVLAFVDNPEKILMRQLLGENIVEQGDHIDVKLLLNRDGTPNLKVSTR